MTGFLWTAEPAVLHFVSVAILFFRFFRVLFFKPMRAMIRVLLMFYLDRRAGDPTIRIRVNPSDPSDSRSIKHKTMCDLM